MNGNISKTRGVLGATGPQGPQGIQGEKGDTPSIVFRYDEKTGNLYYSSDGILVDKEYVNSNDIVTKQQLDAVVIDLMTAVGNMLDRPFVRTVTINLDASKWVEDGGRYAQTVSIINITPYSKVDLQPSAEQLVIFHEKDIAFVTENENGVVTVFCIGQKPTNDYIMQATITEVEKDE